MTPWSTFDAPRSRRAPFAALLACAAALSLAAPTGHAKEEVDRLALAAVLIDGGDADRALSVLDEVDPNDEGLDRTRFHTLRGVAALRLAQYERAYQDLTLAAASENASPQVQVYLARAAYGAGHLEASLLALDRAGEMGRAEPGLYELRAASERGLGDEGAALATLRAGQQRFKDAPALRERELSLLIDAGLYREALERADRGWSSKASRERMIALTNALRQARAFAEAKTIGERALLRFVDDPEVRVAVGRVYADAGEPTVAAAIVEDAARLDPSYASDVAELYRRAGRFEEATAWNARIPDARTKVRQRFGLLMEAGRYDEAAALAPRLSRLKLLEEDALALALAYAHFQTGETGAALSLLTDIEDASLFRQATDLRRAITACRETPERCP